MTHEGEGTPREPPTGAAQKVVGLIGCDLSAIPADERAAHIALARGLIRSVRDVNDGVAFELPADRLRDVARFIDNERRCCRHLAFTLEVPPRGANLTLRISGPGAGEELRALGDATSPSGGGLSSKFLNACHRPRWPLIIAAGGAGIGAIAWYATRSSWVGVPIGVASGLALLACAVPCAVPLAIARLVWRRRDSPH